MLKVRNIIKSFGDVDVLKDVSFEVQKGEVVAVIGASGVGKSTLLRCINFLDKADSGTIIIDDKAVDVEKASKKDIYFLRKSTSMVFQNFNLFKNKTVNQNIMEALVVVQHLSKNKAKEVAMDILRKVGLEEKQNSYPSTLSGGQQQRVAIGRAVAIDPKIMLFDEPTSALDTELVGEVLSLIKELADEKRTMLIVTHEILFAMDVADRVLFMDDGRILEEGTPEEVIINSKNERTKNFFRRFNKNNNKDVS